MFIISQIRECKNQKLTEKYIMKKFLTLFLIFAFALSLTACGAATPDAANETTSVPGVESTAENTETEAKKTIELVAGELGEYGTQITLNKGTEFEQTVIAYHIPAGEYTATNVGEHMGQFNIYSDETHKTDEGWEEPAESFFVKVVDVGATVDFTIADGQYIKIVAPDKFKIEQK